MRRNIKRIALGLCASLILGSVSFPISSENAYDTKTVTNGLSVKDEVIVQGSSNNIEVPIINDKWNFDMINADSKKKKNRNKVKIAILDSGVDECNDVKLEKTINLIPGEESVSTLFWDVSGHGTSVAGIVAAEDNGEGITGINPNAKIYAAKILDSNNQAPISRVIEGINWAIENDVNIINMSFGTSVYSKELHNAVKKAYNNGILMIASAGNGEEVEYPAAFEEVMAVGAVKADGEISESSAKGAQVEIVAPGEQVASTGAFGSQTVVGGTSMAVPHVVGVASLLWQKDLSVSHNFIRQLLNAGANECGDSNEYGNGLVDYEYSLKIYDQFQKEYKEEKTLEENEKNIDENTGAIEIVDAVNGRWGKTTHQSFVYNKNNNWVFTTQEIQLIKKGAVLPDESKYEVTKKGNFPQFHGYYARRDKQNLTNYIACYIMLSKMAVSYASGSYSDPANIAGLRKEDYEVLTRTVGGGIGYNDPKVSWSTILSGYTINARNKSLVLYGMAMHTATDAFAHSAVIDGMRLSNTDGDSETAKNGSYRKASAKYVAEKIMMHIKNKTIGEVLDFAVPSTTHGNKFKMAYISIMAQSVDSSVYSKNSSVFNAMNVESFDIP